MRPLPGSKTGQKTKICRLNEEQATFVISMMKNTKNVVAFKKELVRQFYEMKKLISTIIEARQDFPLLTETIRQAHTRRAEAVPLHQRGGPDKQIGSRHEREAVQRSSRHPEERKHQTAFNKGTVKTD